MLRPHQFAIVFLAFSFIKFIHSLKLTRQANFMRKSHFFLSRQHADVDEDNSSFERIKNNYLIAKFKDCRGDDCRVFCDKNEVVTLLTAILPPITKSELEIEIKSLLGNLPDDGLIEADAFLAAAAKNSYWEKAGSLVVKELIFLDCLHEHYFEQRNLLDNNDYDELKESLTWEGSAAVTLSSKEARFIHAVASFRKGQRIISNDQYEDLKADLVTANSWVVNRQQDPLEKLGLDTFLGYLHRTF